VIARALTGENLVLYANHQCVRDYIFLTDVVQAFLLAGVKTGSNEGASKMFVVGSGEGKTIAEIWQLIADRVIFFTNKNVEVKLDLSVKVGAFEMRNFVADSTRFQSATGWRPQIEMAQGIDLTIQAFSVIQSQPQLDSRR
jgi:nucleoside-diphosphate-sugar epimerase